jgi:hypothetical protein
LWKNPENLMENLMDSLTGCPQGFPQGFPYGFSHNGSIYYNNNFVFVLGNRTKTIREGAYRWGVSRIVRVSRIGAYRSGRGDLKSIVVIRFQRYAL